MKYSKYNVILEEGCDRWLWNTLSGHVVRLDDSAYTFVKRFSPGEPFPDESIYRDICIRDGFIVSDETDETGDILSGYERDLLGEGPDEIRLTVAPGMGCNYNCGYCFESGRRNGKKMSDEVIRTIGDRIRGKLESDSSVKKLMLTWFGGEPLLYSDVIVKLSEALIKICTDHGVLYRSGIITNGRFLDRETASLIREHCVTKAQISMDGTEEDYCRAKGADENDYHAVVSNIRDACGIIDITVRINIADHDVKKAVRLMEHLLHDQALDGRIKVYPAFVRDLMGNSGSEKASYRKYLAMERSFRALFDDRTFRRESLAVQPAVKISSPCSQICASSLLIGPEGELYPCEHLFGDDAGIIGHISDRELFIPKGYAAALPAKECTDCSFLPLCMGGCPRDSAEGHFCLDCDGLRKRLMELKTEEIRKSERNSH